MQVGQSMAKGKMPTNKQTKKVPSKQQEQQNTCSLMTKMQEKGYLQLFGVGLLFKKAIT